MKNKHLILSSCICILGCSTSAHAAYVLTNGNFAGNDTTGWTTSASTGTATVNAASGAAVLTPGTGNAVIYQDFSSGVTGTTENYDFQLDFSFSIGTISDTPRIRLRGNGYAGGNVSDGDIITLRPNAAGNGFERFSALEAPTGWSNALTGISIATGTTYWMRIIGTDLDVSTRSYTVGFSTNGTSYTTSAPLTAFHAAPYPADFETIGFESGTGTTMTVDNITVVPEPTATALGLLALGGLALRRRR